MAAQMVVGTQGDLFINNWLPYRPLAGDNFHEGMFSTSREKALTKMHIQTNPPSIQSLLVVDIDHEDSVMRAMWDREGFRPSWVAENPANGHAHAVWVVKDPIVSTSFQHRKPLGYAYAVTEGLRRSVDGDIHYPGKFMKNPLHDRWELYEGAADAYELSQLDAHLSELGFMPPRDWWKKQRVPVVGIGRNCTLFDHARKWAYRQVPKHRGDAEGLGNAIELMAMQFNVDTFDDPLSHREVKACAHSITKWIVTKSSLWNKSAEEYERDFLRIQSARGRKSAAARAQEQEGWKQQALDLVGVRANSEVAEAVGKSERTIRRHFSVPREEYEAKAESRRETIVRLRGEGMTIRAIAEDLGVSVGTVHRHLKAAQEG